MERKEEYDVVLLAVDVCLLACSGNHALDSGVETVDSDFLKLQTNCQPANIGLSPSGINIKSLPSRLANCCQN